MAMGTKVGAAVRLVLGSTALICALQQPAWGASPSSAATTAQRHDVPNIHDRLIEQYVRNNLRVDPIVDDSNIHLTVRKGVVTLEGSVVCVEEVELAEKIARETRGVREVANRLRSEGHRCILSYGGTKGPSER